MVIICDITTIDQDLPIWQLKLVGKELIDPKAKEGDLQFILEIFPHAETTAENLIVFEKVDTGNIWTLNTFFTLKEPLRFSSNKKEDLFLDRLTMEDIQAAGIRYRIVYTGSKIKDFILKYGLQRYSDAKTLQHCIDILYAGYVVSMEVVHQLVKQHKQVREDAELLGLL